MNKKENHSAKSEIEQALLRLMTQKSYMDITVTDIVQEAKVARVSFYRNFYPHKRKGYNLSPAPYRNK